MVDYGDTRLKERVWARIHPEPMSGCWLWAGPLCRDGYSRTVHEGVRGLHRVMCILAHGAPPDAKSQASHSCDVTWCVNPGHLRWASPGENQGDSVRRKRHASTRKTHCPKNHEYTPENTVLVFNRPKGQRRCRSCQKDYMRVYNKMKRKG